MPKLPTHIHEHVRRSITTLQTSTVLSKKDIEQLDAYCKENPKTNFRLYWMDDNTDVSFLKDLKHLKSLTIDFSPDSLKPVGILTQLEYLEFTANKKLELSDLQRLTSLKELNITLAMGSYSFKSIDNLKRLKKLHYKGKFTDEENLAVFTELEELFPTLQSGDFSCLQPLKKLRYLELNSHKYKGFEGMNKLKNLESLFLGLISQLPEKELNFINELPSLKNLRMDYLPTIQSFRFLNDEASIENLELDTLNGLNSLEGLESLKKLETLIMHGTYKKNKEIDFGILTKCKKIHTLDICGAAMNVKKREALKKVLPTSVKLNK
jgi:hypothetical protein